LKRVRGEAVLRVLSGAALVAGLVAPSLPEPAQDSALEAEFTKKARPLLNQFCVPCHTGEGAAGGLDVAAWKTAADVLRSAGKSSRAIEYLQSRHMPPDGALQPSAAERATLVKFFQRTADEECRLADSGRVTVRRLNRSEFRRSVRDLLYVDLPLTEDFPNDDVGYGFDNIGDVLSLSPLLMEKVMLAAERAAAAAVPAAANRTKLYDASDIAQPERGRATEDGEMVLFANDTAAVNHDFGGGGQFRVKVRAWGQQAGPEVVKCRIEILGRSKTLDVPGTREKPDSFEFPLDAPPGLGRIAVSFINDYYQPEAPDPRQRDRNFTLSSIEIIGPLNATAPMTEARRKLFEGLAGNPAQQAPKALARLAERAYRRPLKPGEADGVVRVYARVREVGGTFEEGIQAGIVAVLCSPHFLFRPESAAGATVAGKGEPLDDFALATRLSYFLWSSVPDATLLDLARAGKLRDPKTLEAQAIRMLQDPKAVALTEDFAGQWLLLRKLREHQPDPKAFPGFDDALRASMVREVELLFERIVREDAPVTRFLDSDTTTVDSRLAAVYGMPDPGPGWKTVKWPDANRRGLLGTAGFLAVTSNPNRTSPVKRGKYVLEQLLGSPLPPPPPDVGVVPDDAKAMAEAPLRERMERHRKDPACAVCHRAMDPIGFALENFDGAGKWRTTDGQHPIDASGDLPDGSKFDGPAELRAVLLSRRGQFVNNLAERLLTYALGRGMRPQDRCHVEDVAARATQGGLKFSAFVRGVVTSDAFRYRSVPEETKK
jgi:hypothetical protein